MKPTQPQKLPLATDFLYFLIIFDRFNFKSVLIIALAPAASLVLFIKVLRKVLGWFLWIILNWHFEIVWIFFVFLVGVYKFCFWNPAANKLLIWSLKQRYPPIWHPPHPLQRCFYFLMRPGKVQTPNMALQHIQYRQFPCGILSSIHLHCCTSIFLHLFSIFPGEIHRWTPGCDHRWFCSWMAGARTWDMSTDAAGYPTQAEHVKERGESSHANASPGGLGVSWESHESLIGA